MGHFVKSKTTTKKPDVKKTKKKKKEDDDNSSDSPPKTHKSGSSSDSDSDDSSGVGSGSTEKSHKSVKQNQRKESDLTTVKGGPVPTSGTSPTVGGGAQDNGGRDPEPGPKGRGKVRSVCMKYLVPCLMTCALASVLAIVMTLVVVYGIGVGEVCDELKDVGTGKGTGDEHKKSKGCPTEFEHNHGNYCYKYVEDAVVWITAVVKCLQLGAHLAEPKSPEEIKFIDSLMQQAAVWVGGHGIITAADNYDWTWISDMSTIRVEKNVDLSIQHNCMVLCKITPTDHCKSFCYKKRHYICQQRVGK